MSVNTAIMRRKLGLPGRIEIDFALDRIRLKEAIRLNPALPDPDEQAPKTYGVVACSKLNNGVMAIANEDGYIDLLQTRKLEQKAHWLGHENAIFDIKASPNKSSLLTASGDKTIKLWDVETKKDITTIAAHDSTIKSISFFDPNTIASGSRDGSIKIHDLRGKRPKIVIRDAHRNKIIGRVRRSSAKTDPVSVVTNVVFDHHFPRIYSTGANDATIKLWDLRGRVQTNKPRRAHNGDIMINQPYLEVHHPSKGLHCGYSHLLLTESCKLFASCSDNKIYCYNNFGSTDEPIKFTGYRYDTYLRLAVMDERLLISGAQGGGALMWTLGNKNSSIYYPETTKQPVGVLRPDNNERYDTNVVETDWESLSIITFRDDSLVSKWTMHHVLESERKKLADEATLPMAGDDVTIEMSDIINVNVLRPNHRVNNALNTV